MEYVNANGARVPALGFGVFRMSDDEVEAVTSAALDAGFRHFDTAQIYGNEAALGRALKSAGAKRDDLFLTTKVWVDKYQKGDFAASVDESLEKIGVDQVDLLLLHWPGKQVPIAQQIELLNEVRAAGKTRNIGVSNQNIAQLRESVERSEAPIATNQIEIHPYLDQSAMEAAAKELGVALTAYFVMADGAVPKDAALATIGEKHGKTAAQVALRWVLQKGHIALSKTATTARVPENIDVFDFDLSAEEMAAISDLARPDGRLVSPDELRPDWDS